MITTPKAQIWWMACRPKTLPAAAAPVIVGTAMAWDAGRFHFGSALCALLGALLIQIGTNLANDYYDHAKGTDTPERLGPTRVTQAGLASPNAVFLAMALTFLAACIPGLYIVWRGGWVFVIVGLLSILSGILYTAGPWPLGYLGLGDLFVFVFFGLIAVGGTFYVQALELSANVLWAGSATGLFSVAILTVNNLRDIDQDRKGGKRTLAVRFGRTFAKVEYLICILSGGLLIPAGLALHNGRWGVLLSAVVVLLAFSTIHTVFSQEDGPALNRALALTGKLLLLFSLLFSAGWLL